jgi:hypothetical protein
MSFVKPDQSDEVGKALEVDVCFIRVLTHSSRSPPPELFVRIWYGRCTGENLKIWRRGTENEPGTVFINHYFENRERFPAPSPSSAS